ncbi:DmX-like protein 2 [Durusdinium trenchii]|uniref:DmX-like protein 2 n=1 Tax=Durusdinium trenchii TaxID=1381693 RepID=A0ABP0N2Q8_9DINO
MALTVMCDHKCDGFSKQVPATGQPGRSQPMQMPMPQGLQPGWNVPVVCAVQDVKQVQEHVRVPQMPMKTGLVPPQKAFNFCAAQAPNGFYAPPQEDSDGESIGQGVTFQRARSEGDCGTGSEMPGENLPVERTFIQFSTHGDSCKRSRSQ